MISLNFDSLYRLKKHGLREKDVVTSERNVTALIHKVESREQGFLDLAGEVDHAKEILAYAKCVAGKFDHLVVLGIGGSALGVSALFQSLKPLNWNEMSAKQRGGPTLHVLDNVDPELIESMDRVLDYKKTLFIVITKSGTTPETMAQYFYFRKKVNAACGKLAHEHFVFITDSSSKTLREIAAREHMMTFAIPENVGGRFSVLSAVGLLPAALLGIDILKLLKGASRGVQVFFEEKPEENMGYQLAQVQYLLQQKHGVCITVMMPYSSALARVADWYAQLLAESIGKAKTRDGKIVNAGLTPVSALGVTDQHSQVQLYNEGPFDKLILFLEVKKFRSSVSVPKLGASERDFDFLSRVPFAELIHVEKQATEQALQSYDRPCGTIEMTCVDEEHLGELFMILECSVAMLGEMYDINAFNQPGVELAKVTTKQLLAKKMLRGSR